MTRAAAFRAADQRVACPQLSGVSEARSGAQSDRQPTAGCRHSHGGHYRLEDIKGRRRHQPNPELAARGKKGPNLTENDRKLNRRVEVILEPGLSPVQEIPINLFPPGLGQGGIPPYVNTLPPPPPASQPQKQREWLKSALEQDPLLKTLPPFVRNKAIDAGKDLDETAAEKVIDALPIDGAYKPAVQAAVKALLQMLKGKKFTEPVPQPPQYQMPPSVAPPFPKAPGEKIFTLPPIRW